ncbi:hypothetical protein [Algisphaera agarilytica]|uniref:Uncharacterized protein n=1 Tax=Algisphaera agarilytica TaxID=1385975 RepID=A0A7X0H8N0_9BACT|nr:hypothetical protein [Algisphaera agarilytica]MBB6431314.1 hypothetical protein [Algisphaera agarilytica]
MTQTVEENGAWLKQSACSGVLLYGYGLFHHERAKMKYGYWGAVLVLAVLPAVCSWALAGTSRVVGPGQALNEQMQEHYAWPMGTWGLVNAPCRQNAWQPWFSERVSDVIHFELAPTNLDEVNGLLAQLSAIDIRVKQVILNPGKEPYALGFVTALEEGNGLPMIFSIGSQLQNDLWFDRLEDGKFGVYEYHEAPRALPPTMAIYVGHDLIDLNKLQISPNVRVSVAELGPEQVAEWGERLAPLREFVAAHEARQAEHQLIPEAVRRRD